MGSAQDLFPEARVFLVVATVLSLLFYLLFLHESKAARFLRNFPGPPTLPLFGNSLYFSGSPEDYLYNMEHFPREFGQRVRFFAGPLKLLLLFDPVDIEKVLGSSVLLNKSRMYEFLLYSLGPGLSFSPARIWHTRRKLLTPAFHFKILESFHTIFYEQSQVLLELLREKSQRGEAVDILSMVSRCALDVICETSMGTKLNCQRDLDKPFAKAFMQASGYVSERIMNPFLYPEFIFARSPLGRRELANRMILMEFVQSVIDERRAQIIKIRAGYAKDVPISDVNDQKKKFALLDLLIHLQLDGKGDLTDKDIFHETATFMIGGHDTTAASITFTLYLLSIYPEEQEKVYAELEDIFRDNYDRTITTNDLPNLKYLDAVIKESLRLYPSIPVIGRRVDQDVALDDKTILPAGLDILLYPYFTHRNPQYYPEPEVFRPSRFFPENCVGRHPYAYIPFSAGPRNCIGQKYALMEEKVILANILRHYRVKCVNPEQMRVKFEVFIRPKHDLLFEFAPREK